MVHTVSYLIDEFALELVFLGREGLDSVRIPTKPSWKASTCSTNCSSTTGFS